MKPFWSFKRRNDCLKDDVLFIILRKVVKMSVELDALKGKITALETAVDQLISITGQLAVDIVNAKEDPATIQALADSVQGEIDKVTAAIAADAPIQS
jgi:hypothetical protein